MKSIKNDFEYDCLSFPKQSLELFSLWQCLINVELFRFKHYQWPIIVVVVLLLIPLQLVTVFPDEFRNAFLRKFFVPGVEAKFGYKTERHQLFFGEQPLDVYVISFVEANGIMANSGVRVGDVPIGFVSHKSDVYLADQLTMKKAETNHIKVVDLRLYEDCLNKMMACSLWENERDIIVPIYDK